MLTKMGLWFLDSLDFFLPWSEHFLVIFHNPLLTVLFAIVAMAVGAIGALFAYRKYKEKYQTKEPQPRFRKRDKMMFYGIKMLRKVRSLSHQAAQARRIKKRQMVLRLAKRLLRMKRDQPLTLQVMEPSQAFLEEATSDPSDHGLPPEVMYMIRSIRVFGFFEKPLFLELCKSMESSPLQADNLLFSIGEPDDSIYIVQTGRLVVFVLEADGSELILREVGAGESITSLLSVMDVLTGNIAPYKTVSARALEDSVILRLKVAVFRKLLDKDPESLVRVAQIIMVRLQRVTFTALHNYLGLTNQLIKSSSSQSKRVSVVASPKTSPSRPSLRRHSHVAQMTHSWSLGDAQSADKPPESNEPCFGAQGDRFINPSELDSKEYATDVCPSAVVSSLLCNPKEVRNAPDGQEAPKQRKRKASFLLPHEIAAAKEYEEDMLSLAVKGFAQQLDLDDESVLKDFVTVKEYPASAHIIKEDAVEDVALLYVLTGSLSVSQKTVDKMEESVLFVVHAGEIMGALAVLSGEPSLFTVSTRHPSTVGILSKKHTYEVLRMKPLAVLHLAQSVIKRLSPFVRQIDFALDWMNVESGRAIYRQDDVSDSTYIVLSGRLRSVLKRPDGKKELVGEYGRGDLVGIVEVLTSTRRSTTVMAVRNSELAKLPDGLLNAIKIKYPEVVTRFIHLLGHRILGSLQKGLPSSDKAVMVDSRPTGSNFATVAILQVTESVPLVEFTLELQRSLAAIGPTLRLTSDIIKKMLGPTALSSANEYRLCNWLGQQEDQHRLVLYQCDTYFTMWTQRCVRQADCIILVAFVDDEPTVGRLEKELENIAVRTQKELILLHRDDGIKPRNTVQWLNMRSWCSSHHHIRCPKRLFYKRSSAKSVESHGAVSKSGSNIHSDFARLARFLTGTSFGLVLGGGGARGAAHVGMIRAIQEAGVPIDMIGGVSIGAFMGALWCQEHNLTTFTQKAREWSLKMNSYWRQILDLTYPATAMFTGAAFNRTIHEVFGERQIEDLWLPYFTVTTDITDSTMRVHTHGSLWRYIRSSMSLSGYMPPMCDPQDGHLLLDGGYVNNLPADIMRDMGAETIIAIDVGSQDDMDLTNYGDTLSGWWLLWKKWNPWATPVKVPSLQEIQSRLAYVSCVKQLDQIKRSDYCTYVRPPIDKYKTLQFGSFDEIMDVGYNHGKNIFPAMKEGHKALRDRLPSKQERDCHKPATALRDASFTDLAEMVCKIKRPHLRSNVENISDDEEDGMFLHNNGGYSSDPETSLLADTDKEDESEDRQRENIGSFSDVEYAAEREL